MSLLYVLLGILILTAGIIDLPWTTLWVEGGAGPLTSRVMKGTWRTFRKVGSHHSRFLSLSGPLILGFSLLVWTVLLWIGWTFIFAGTENALIDTQNPGPISWIERFYFTGYTIFTLGNGDFVLRDGIWQIATVFATASGMLFVTMSVTYVLSVLDAVTQKRSFASSVSGLGTQSDVIVRTSWDEGEFQGLDLPLNSFISELSTLTTNHKAYPILHYFHSEQDAQSPVVTVTVLDEALTLLKFGISERDHPPELILNNARSTIQRYLDMLSSAVPSADQTPSAPDLEVLRKNGIPTVSDDEFTESLEKLTDRRRQLLGLIEADARQWPTDET